MGEEWDGPADRRRNGVEVTLPGGIKVRARGLSVLLTLVLLVLCATLGLLYVHDLGEKEFRAQVAATMQSLSNREAEMNYILTLTPEERSKLNLAMPDSLRQRLRNGGL